MAEIETQCLFCEIDGRIRMMTEKKIGMIKEELQAAEDTSLPFFIETYEKDLRAGVQKLVEQARKRLQKLEDEKQRIYALQEYERKYPDAAFICGIEGCKLSVNSARIFFMTV